MIEIFCRITLNLLPYYANDFPSNDKADYYKMVFQWSSNMEFIIQSMVNNFC